MPLNVTDTGGSDFKKVPQGTHVAVCNAVVDIGMQETNFGSKHQVYLRFEIPDERVEYEKDGEQIEAPMSIGATFTASLAEKANLRRHLEAWRGRAFTDAELKGFDMFKVLGVPCLITVTHRESGGKVYANVTGITALPKSTPVPKVETELLRFSDDEPGDFDKLPDWLQQKINKQVKPSGANNAPSSNGDDFDDDIPF